MFLVGCFPMGLRQDWVKDATQRAQQAAQEAQKASEDGAFNSPILLRCFVAKESGLVTH